MQGVARNNGQPDHGGGDRAACEGRSVPVDLESLFLRDGRNRLFVCGRSRKFIPAHAEAVPHPFLGVLMLAAIGLLALTIPLGPGRDLSEADCLIRRVIACAQSVLRRPAGETIARIVLIAAGAAFMLVVLALCALGLLDSLRFQRRLRRLRKAGVITYGHVTHCVQRFVDVRHGPNYFELELQYAFAGAGREAMHTERIRREPDADLRQPLAGTPVAILYVDEALWELL